MDATSFLEHLKRDPEYKDQIVHVQYIPARDARPGWLDRPLHTVLQDRLDELGVSTLYSHQADAVNAIRTGHNVMVSTPSASGRATTVATSPISAVKNAVDHSGTSMG